MKKKQIRPTKKDHATKNSNEKKWYRELLNMPEKEINETTPYNSDEIDEDNFDSNGNISETTKDNDYRKLRKIDTTDEEKPKEKVKPYESFSTKISRYAKDIVIGVILFGIIGVAVNAVWSQQKDIATILANITSITKEIDNLRQKYENINNDKIGATQIITEIKKDLEFVKLRLDKIEFKN